MVDVRTYVSCLQSVCLSLSRSLSVNVFSMCYHSPDLQVGPIHIAGLLLWQFCESIYERLAQFFNLLLSVNIKQQATAFKDSVCVCYPKGEYQPGQWTSVRGGAAAAAVHININHNLLAQYINY